MPGTGYSFVIPGRLLHYKEHSSSVPQGLAESVVLLPTVGQNECDLNYKIIPFTIHAISSPSPQ